MKPLDPGTQLDGFTVGTCIHSGATAHVYRVHTTDALADPGFPMVMKVPHTIASGVATGFAASCEPTTTVRLEVEGRILQTLQGRHTPRFVAAADMLRTPYVVMEFIEGQTLTHWLEGATPPDPQAVAHLGAAMAHAVHALHQQATVHLGLRPDHLLFREDGSVVLLGLGLSYHTRLPDLLADPTRKALGSPGWIAPEQVVGVRGDPRSDVFALGVMLYQLCTGQLPFGAPTTRRGLRLRLWQDPVPPRHVRPLVPAWLQEIVLRCLEPQAAHRYPSAAHLALDLTYPHQVAITERGNRVAGIRLRTLAKRWVRAANLRYRPSPSVTRQILEVPIVLVAIPPADATDATLLALRLSAARAVGSRPGAHLACVTVIAAQPGDTTNEQPGETPLHLRHLVALQQWAKALNGSTRQTSFHVLESGDVSQALLNFARRNHTSSIVMGAATHGLSTHRAIAPVPIRVAMDAPCTVVLVRPALPYELLAQSAQRDVDTLTPPALDNNTAIDQVGGVTDIDLDINLNLPAAPNH